MNIHKKGDLRIFRIPEGKEGRGGREADIPGQSQGPAVRGLVRTLQRSRVRLPPAAHGFRLWEARPPTVRAVGSLLFVFPAFLLQVGSDPAGGSFQISD